MPSFSLARRYLAVLLVVALAGAAAAQAPRPVSLAERRAELDGLANEIAALRPRVDETMAKVRSLEPSFEAAHRRVQAVPLDVPARKRVLEQGLAGLDPARAKTFQEAASAFAGMGAALAEHFDAYDRMNTAQIREISGGCLVRTLTKAQLLDQYLSDKQRAKVVAALSELARADEQYHNTLDDPNARNWDRSSKADAIWEASVAADKVIDPLMSKHGQTPGVPLGAKLRRLGETIAYYARGAKAVAGSVPAMARVTAYLFNPFRRKGDPEKFSQLLRSLGKSYTWASGMKLEVVGRERIPSDTSIVYAIAHRSGLEDAVTMASVLPTDFAFMAAAGVFPKAIASKLGKQPSMILVGGRKPGTDQRVDAVKDSIAALQSGLDLAIFPEGTTPTRHQETHPLRHGIDAITAGVGERPVAIVAVTMDDPSQDYQDRLKRQSLHGGLKLTVTFSEPIDPLKLKAVPGATSQLLLNVVRAFYHRHLFWKVPAAAHDLGTVPAAAAAAAPAN